MTDWACCMPQNTVLYILINFHSFISWSRPLQGMDPCVPPPPPTPSSVWLKQRYVTASAVCPCCHLCSLSSPAKSWKCVLFLWAIHPNLCLYQSCCLALPFHVHICFCKHFVLFFSFFCLYVLSGWSTGPLLNLICRDQTMWFIRFYYPWELWHEFIVLIILHWGFISSVSPLMRVCGLEMEFNKGLIMFASLNPLLLRIALYLCHFVLAKWQLHCQS